MISYLVRRLLLLPVILFGVTLLIFAMLSRLSVGQRAALYVRQVPRTADGMQRIIERYGLEDPLPLQYGRWLAQVARGDLGFSLTGKEPVAAVIRHHLPGTLELLLWSLPLIWLGVSLGRLAAVQRDRAADQALRLLSSLAASTPAYLLGLLALLFLAARLGWLPAGGRLSAEAQIVVGGAAWRPYTGMYTADALLNRRPDVLLDAVHHLLLPVFTLAAGSLAYLLRLTRASMLEALEQDYVRTAAAKGLSPDRVVRGHVWPNARLPVVTFAGMMLVGLLGGVAMVETVFNLPGLGNRFLQAAANVDVITTLGLTLYGAVVLVLGNLAVDLMYFWLDPRIRRP